MFLFEFGLTKVISIAAKVSAVLLAGAVIAASFSVTPFASEASSHPLGCPLHSHPAPSHLPLRLPLDHHCCQAGHDAAIVPESPNLKFLLPYSSAFELSPAITKDAAENFLDTAGLHAKSPGALSLRI